MTTLGKVFGYFGYSSQSFDKYIHTHIFPLNYMHHKYHSSPVDYISILGQC